MRRHVAGLAGAALGLARPAAGALTGGTSRFYSASSAAQILNGVGGGARAPLRWAAAASAAMRVTHARAYAASVGPAPLVPHCGHMLLILTRTLNLYAYARQHFTSEGAQIARAAKGGHQQRGRRVRKVHTGTLCYSSQGSRGLALLGAAAAGARGVAQHANDG
jgi:hypothetical protein